MSGAWKGREGTVFEESASELIALGNRLHETGSGADSNQALFAQRWIEDRLSTGSAIDLDVAYDEAHALAALAAPSTKDCAQAVSEMRNGPTFCYMAFFGLAGIGRFIKIGRSKHPEGRVYGLTTGNPFDLMGVYACKFPTRSIAHRMEQSLLRALKPISRRGEWVEVEPFGQPEIGDVARRLSGAALTPEGLRPAFEPLWITQGKAA